jgi:arsenite methyltransferase
MICIDFSDTMLERARKAAHEAAVANASFEHGDAENLPLADACIDVAIVNGIFSLNPAREFIFSKLARVLRRGGVAYSAELILASPLPPNVQQTESDWFA